MLQHLTFIASSLSLRDTASYSLGLCKFHVFCDIFSIPEAQWLPASFTSLHSYVLWATLDPSPNDTVLAREVPFKPVTRTTIQKYLAVVCTWYLGQSWTLPLLSDDVVCINWFLQGFEKKPTGSTAETASLPAHHCTHASRPETGPQSDLQLGRVCLGSSLLHILGAHVL